MLPKNTFSWEGLIYEPGSVLNDGGKACNNSLSSVLGLTDRLRLSASHSTVLRLPRLGLLTGCTLECACFSNGSSNWSRRPASLALTPLYCRYLRKPLTRRQQPSDLYRLGQRALEAAQSFYQHFFHLPYFQTAQALTNDLLILVHLEILCSTMQLRPEQ
jgi:hypothetical protein